MANLINGNKNWASLNENEKITGHNFHRKKNRSRRVFFEMLNLLAENNAFFENCNE